MSKTEKLVKKFKTASLFPWKDLVTMLQSLGFSVIEGDGSRVKFIREDIVISLHKPHPQKEVKAYAVRQVRDLLKAEGLI